MNEMDFQNSFNMIVYYHGGGGIKRINSFYWLVLGIFCFLITQPLLRINILKYLQTFSEYQILFMNPLKGAFFLAFTAGLFEETGRFFFKMVFKSDNNYFQAILFGLGHAVAEIFFIFYILYYSGIYPNIYSFIERISATLIHIGLTVIVWNGFLRNKKFSYYIVAIFLHTSVNMFPYLINSYVSSIVIIETLLFAISCAFLYYAIYSKKYYFREDA